MKNRVYLYCIIFAVIFIASFSIDVFNAASDVKRGWQDEGKYIQEHGHTSDMSEIALEFKSSNVSKVHNKKTNKDINIYRKNLVLDVKQSSSLTETIDVVTTFITAIAAFFLLPNIILVLISIGKKEIFTNKFEKRLSRIGFACIIININFLLFCTTNHIEACKQVEIEGYYHTLFTGNSFTGIYIGLILLIGAQVFKMARTLQEEQDLTI